MTVSSNHAPWAETLVVGAGLAGLTIAHRLQQYGLAVTVAEARDRPGGRVYSIPNALNTPLTAEMGGEAFDSDHVACLNLAQALGLLIVDLWQQMPANLTDAFWFNYRPQCPKTMQAEFAALLRSRQSDWQSVQHYLQGGPLTEEVRALDGLSIADYLQRHGVSRSLYQGVTTAYASKYGMDAAEQSSLNLLSYFQTAADCDALFGNADERFYLPGGNAQLTTALFEQVGDRVHLQTCLEALAETADGRYRATLRQGKTLDDRTFTRVVLTIPFSVLRHLDLRVALPNQQRQAIHTLGYSTPTKIISAYGDRPWRRRGYSGLLYTDLPVQHCWEASDSLQSPAAAALLVAYPGGKVGHNLSQRSSPQTAAHLLTDLDAIFPALSQTRLTPAILCSNWQSDPFAQGAYSCYRMGQWTQFDGCEGQRVGNLFFAGEHCSRRYQGYMEGACETAERVVLEILQDLGSPQWPQQQARLAAYQQQRQRGFSLPPASPLGDRYSRNPLRSP